MSRSDHARISSERLMPNTRRHTRRDTRRRTRSTAARWILGLAALATPLTACTDDFLTETPKDIIAADNLYVNLAGFDAGLNGLYFQVRRERFGQDNSVNNILSTAYSIGVDNGYGLYLSPPERTFTEFGVRSTPTNDFTNSIWNWLYQTINGANTVIGRAENPAVQWTAADHDRVVGEEGVEQAGIHPVHTGQPV